MSDYREEKGLHRGRIIRSQSGFYTVQTQQGLLICRLRGRLKKTRLSADIIAVGDWVWVQGLDEQSGLIEEIEPRERVFSRRAPKPYGEYQQILIANPDQVILVFSCSQPSPRLAMLDRYLVIAEKQALPVIIVVNKVDLMDIHTLKQRLGHYEALGYKTLYTSVRNGQGIGELKIYLAGKLSLFTGPSGVGKSSLLNAIQPGLGLAVRQVSRATRKGRHATVVREMFPLDAGGYVADTPGLKALAFWDIEPDELDGYFPEMRLLVQKCQFSDCTHAHEPGCAILEAVEKKQIHPARYQSYLRMRFGESDTD